MVWNSSRVLHSRTRHLVGAFAFCCVFVAASVVSAEEPSPRGAPSTAGDRLFALKVLPIFKAKCFGCHGDDAAKLKGDFDLRSRAALLAGGESGEPGIIPGRPEESLLLRAVRWDGLEMPPKENDRLTVEQIAAIETWIKSGAAWPAPEVRERIRLRERSVVENEDGILVATSGGLADEWTYRRYQREDLWAFQPIRKPVLPETASSSEETKPHPVDAFIDARRDAAGFAAAPEADPVTLLRRAKFDLTGLPPSPAEIVQFLAHWKRNPDEAWTDLIDRLLASPHYGERWAQHWLDVARYADTGGYSNDYERSNAWRYRDYVIRSFNDDKPYDRFVTEQLAGDELADASVRERTGGDDGVVRKTRLSGEYTESESEWIVATGFLRMGPWDNAMVKAPEARQIYLDDVVHSVGQTFLSMSLRCVKCHDHKFDPIPTRDYYRIYAAFAGTQMAERPAPFLEAESHAGFETGKALVETMKAFAVSKKNAIKEKQEAAARAWFRERGLEYKTEKERRDLPDEEKPPRYFGLDHVDEGRLKVREQDEWIWNRRLERYQPMAQSVYNGSDAKFAWNGARKLRINPKSDPAWRPASFIYSGGALSALGEAVSPGVLSATGVAASGATEEDPYRVPDGLEGRRLALAKWIVDPKNPLTARSIVNRIWQHHFVHPIARNPNSFGAKGAKPTHPGLLDWLAADFVENGWTMKRLHRLIMTSRAYRQATGHAQLGALREKDPENRLLAYRPARRLTAEELRDSLLAVTGELNPRLGGLPVMPEINIEVALQPRMIQFSIAPAYQPSPTPAERNRRTIYAYRVRGMADPFLELFNQPNPNDSCEDRDAAAVTPQAFTLLNSDVMTDRSIAFALRLEREADTLASRIARAFLLAYGREPSEEERERGTRYVEEMRGYHERTEPPPVRFPTSITRSLVEEFSGKVFEYEEILPVYKKYAADPKPAQTSAGTRALADLCLLLFNSSEFLYVY